MLTNSSQWSEYRIEQEGGTVSVEYTAHAEYSALTENVEAEDVVQLQKSLTKAVERMVKEDFR